MSHFASSLFISSARSRWSIVLASWMFMCACETGGSEDQTDGAVPDASRRDMYVAPPDAFVPECDTADAGDACDDGVACTMDACEAGRCVHRSNHAACDDGVFCNGAEVCDFQVGCTAGPPQTCDDMDVCTIDRCDEEANSCEHLARDLDDDGEADWHCPGGTDCDDRDPARSTSTAEICSDGVDNDCDESIDETDCGRAAHDTCDDPFVISAAGTYVLTTDGAIPDYRNSCSSESYRDIVVRLDIAETTDITVEADSDYALGLGLRTTCDLGDSEVECNAAYPARVRRRSVAPGSYYLVVASPGPAEVGVTVTFSPPTDRPTNETCDGAIDITSTMHVDGSFVDTRDDFISWCAYFGMKDLVYSFTLEEEKDVVVSAVSDSGDWLVTSVQSDCSTANAPIRCTGGTPSQMRVHRLPAGTYFVIVEGTPYYEVDFTLDIALLDPTDAVAGDTCSTPIVLTSGEMVTDSLVGTEDDINLSCSSFLRDKVYSFTLTERSDVSVFVDGASVMISSVRTDCDDYAGELRCMGADPIRYRLNDIAPGTYYVIVEGYGTPGYTLTYEKLPPTVPVAVSGNDTCSTAYNIPMGGGVFTGTTATSFDNYSASCGADAASNDVVYRLTLSDPRRVRAWVTGVSFDPVLVLQSGTSCDFWTEIACADDGGGGTVSSLDVMLAAGTYYFVVDGFGLSSSGAYTLEVSVGDP